MHGSKNDSFYFFLFYGLYDGCCKWRTSECTSCEFWREAWCIENETQRHKSSVFSCACCVGSRCQKNLYDFKMLSRAERNTRLNNSQICFEILHLHIEMHMQAELQSSLAVVRIVHLNCGWKNNAQFDFLLRVFLRSCSLVQRSAMHIFLDIYKNSMKWSI